MKKIERQANWFIYPEVIKPSGQESARQVIIGDLHGSVLKLIYILIEEGILEISSEDYDKIVKIYFSDLTEQSLEEFKKIINQAKVNTKIALTLLGDDLADRGKNDYLTLLVEKKLHEELNHFDIVLSNHGWEFIRLFYLAAFKLGLPQDLMEQGIPDSQTASFINMSKSIREGIIKQEEVLEIFRDCILPHLKLFSFSLSQKGVFNLFSHAPCGIETIRLFCNGFGLPFNDQTLETLAITIIELNKHFKALLSTAEGTAYLNKIFMAPHFLLNKNENKIRRALFIVTWNRGEKEFEQGQSPYQIPFDEIVTKTTGLFNIERVYGHIGQIDYPGNLDNHFGKTESCGITCSEIKHYTGHSSAFVQNELIDELSYKIKKPDVFYEKYKKPLFDHLEDLKKIKDEIGLNVKKNENVYKRVDTAYTKIFQDLTLLFSNDEAFQEKKLYEIYQESQKFFIDMAYYYIKKGALFCHLFKAKTGNKWEEDLSAFQKNWQTALKNIMDDFKISTQYKTDILLKSIKNELNHQDSSSHPSHLKP